MSKSTRNADVRANEELEKFLDEYFYKRLIEAKHFSKFERIRDKERQCKGIDIIASAYNDSWNIDEKAAMHYINQNIPTFSFELASYQKDRLVEGWLVNDKLLTNYYFLLYPNARENVNFYNVTKDDFTTIEGIMLDKNKLLKALSEAGLTKEEMLRNKDKMLRENIYGKMNSIIPWVKYNHTRPKSDMYSEQPVNILVSKNKLIDISDAHYKISKEGVEIQVHGNWVISAA